MPQYKEFKDNIPTLLVLCLALVISVIDGTVLNVSINDINRELGSNLKEIQWVITCYSLVIAALTIFGGKLGDIYGAKKMFISGAVIFGIGSALTAFAPNINFLLFGWSIVEGIGAALMIPASSSLIVANFAPQDRGKAFGIYGASAGIGSAIGPILGGYLTTAYSWRWAFGINLFVVAILVLSSAIVKEMEKQENAKINIDFVGVLLSSFSLVTLSYGIIESSDYGWWKTTKPVEFLGKTIDILGYSITPIMISLGIISLITFLSYEADLVRKNRQPLIDLRIFRNRQFTVGVIASGIVFSGFVGIITFGIALFFQKVLNLSAFDSGLGLVPLSVAAIIMAPLSNKISGKITPKNTVLIGLAISALASVYLYYTLSINATQNDLILPLEMFGTGFGLLASQLSSLTLESVSRSESGVASGINGTVREVGRTFGSAIIGAAFISTFLSSFVNNIQTTNIPQALKSQIAQASSGSSQQNEDNDPCQKSDDISNQICLAQKSSYVEGSRSAIMYTGGFTILCFIAVLFFESEKKREERIDAEAIA
jgi:EmrB/QacA subfamily drug resistance transporter